MYVSYMTTDNMVRGANQGNSKFVDILDVFGIVWFAVGNLLVFNDFECIPISPIVFLTSFFYIVFSYVSFFLPSILRCTMGICSPTAEEDIQYLRQTADADREAAFINRNGGNGRVVEMGPNRVYSPDLTPERARYWAEWLQTYGCYAVAYHPSMDLKGRKEASAPAAAVAATSPGQVTLKDRDGEDESDAGDIELGLAGTGGKREYVCVPTSATPAGDSVAVGAGEEEGDFCSVCLLPFECAPPAGSATDAAPPSSEEGKVEENNSIIVRYPCRGHHYFHAHCLHSWLQVASARYLNTRRAPRGSETDHHLQVTCPCCREHPRNLLEEGTAGSAGGSGSAGRGGGAGGSAAPRMGGTQQVLQGGAGGGVRTAGGSSGGGSHAYELLAAIPTGSGRGRVAIAPPATGAR